MNPTNIEILATTFFALAIIHTFSTKFFDKLSKRYHNHSGIFHLLAEVEVVFGFWALALVLCMFAISGKDNAVQYVESRNFTESLFVFCIMVISASKPILYLVNKIVNITSKILPMPRKMGLFFLCLFLVPILGSFITEPAAMTLGALILKDKFFPNISNKLKYACLSVLFVNISIGGTLTSFAAPPILMVASTWKWDLAFMVSNFGYKAVIAVFINALGITLLFRKELLSINFPPINNNQKIPLIISLIHIVFLGLLVLFAHYSAIFMGIFLFFLGFCHAYEQYNNKLLLKEGLLVAFFLAGLVVLGGKQQWWLEPILTNMNEVGVFFGAILLTAITDNAAITYLGSTISGLSDGFKYALVAGAVTGGGLTVIANAPNPAGLSILKDFFDNNINPLKLFAYSLLPTIVAGLAFMFL